MPKFRALTASEKHELIYALSIAKINHRRHENECNREADACSNEQISGDLRASAEAYKKSTDIDELLQKLASGGKIVIIEDEEQ